MSRWFDKACEQLEEELITGQITQEEFRKAMSALRAELREEASENAREAYDHTMGDY